MCLPTAPPAAVRARPTASAVPARVAHLHARGQHRFRNAIQALGQLRQLQVVLRDELCAAGGLPSRAFTVRRARGSAHDRGPRGAPAISMDAYVHVGLSQTCCSSACIARSASMSAHSLFGAPTCDVCHKNTTASNRCSACHQLSNHRALCFLRLCLSCSPINLRSARVGEVASMITPSTRTGASTAASIWAPNSAR